MAETGPAFHYVCTREQAWELMQQRDRFWVSNCGCREERGGRCRQSRMDVCLQFRPQTGASGSGCREITREEVQAIFREAETHHLVTRPFHREDDLTADDGICFCCNDCCSYFLNRAERCDKGSLIERTDFDACTHCGICEEICYFGARAMNGELIVNREECYGCGLCAEVCPEECIALVPREPNPICGI
jgi:Pyruvate/2-oxoacid:ferredoxin oxidoreductase delta subunit